VDQARNPFSDLRPGVFSYFQGEGGAGAEPFFQGEGGAGAEPFFQGDGGAGADPFFQGEGGAGAEPFAVNTEPLPLPATAVFRPIAPTRITIAATTVSFRDIVPPRNKLFPEGNVPFWTPMSRGPTSGPVLFRRKVFRIRLQRV
jgi:hypothetical protein